MQNNYLPLLKEFVRFKSVSTDPKFKADINKTVEWLKKQFVKSAFKVEIIKGYGNPLVLASLVADKKLKTVLIYGHYDVQPASKSDGWKSEPFELFEDKERLYARGIIDNKGQVLVHIAAVFDLIEKDQLNYNVKFLLEGDEETGSEHIEEFFKENKHKLTADFVMISDAELTGKHACLDTSFRGIVNVTLKIKTSEKDNHSGLYGGSIPNAATELANILSKMHDEDSNLTIGGINNGKKIDRNILKNNKNIPYSKSDFLEITGVKKRFNEKEFDFYSQTGFLTSAEITTLSSGYMGEGYRNAIPGKASAKINFRLAPDLSVKELRKIFGKYVEENVPNYFDYELNFDQSSNGFFIDTKSDIAQETKKILKKAFGTEVFDRPCGAIIPIVGFFIKYLKVDVISVGLVNEDCNMHGANENYKKDVLEKALKFSNLFFAK